MTALRATRTVRNWESGRVAMTGPARVAIRLMLELHRILDGTVNRGVNQ